MMDEGVAQFLGEGRIAALAGASIVLVLMAFVARAILTSRRLEGSSLFNRLFVVVAVTSGFFSAVSSAIGFSLITSQETDDFFRNSVLPPAFGVFVFCLSVAIWVGGAEMVRHRDWFRGVGNLGGSALAQDVKIGALNGMTGGLAAYSPPILDGEKLPHPSLMNLESSTD